MNKTNAAKINLTKSHDGWYTANVGGYGEIAIIRDGKVWRAAGPFRQELAVGSLSQCVDSLARCG